MVGLFIGLFSHLRLAWFIRTLKLFQEVVSLILSSDMIVSSWMDDIDEGCIGGAGGVHMAVPDSWYQNVSPNRKTLLHMTTSLRAVVRSAAIRVYVYSCLCSFRYLLVKYSACGVCIDVYIEIASAVNNSASGGTLIVTSSSFR